MKIGSRNREVGMGSEEGLNWEVGNAEYWNRI